MPDPTPVPALSANRLSMRYGRRAEALRDVDLELSGAGLTGLVGPNGAGKSTLIKIWAGLERPTGGRAAVMGSDPWRDRRRALAHVGYVPQVAALYRDLTVADHLSLARVERQRFDIGLSRRYLTDFEVPLDARSGDLSGGQRAQVSLALALGMRTPVLLLDEPLASLDPVARRQILHVLASDVAASGAVALLSSHVVGDIEEACDRIVLLGRGAILLDASLASAVSTHRVSDSGQPRPAGLQHVAEFVGADRGLHDLWRAPAGAAASIARPATLDEVVVGYLTSAGAAGRSDA
jgi:ABC-2 type transport system ATP-binding protein